MKRLIKILVLFVFMSCTKSSDSDKTLVAWVHLSDSVDMEGSVITIQDGKRFDGIHLSLENGGTWIAGSENNNRTLISKGIPVGKSNREELIQLAIVYIDSEIRMYRNGELQSSYPVENIDILSSNKNFVLFGYLFDQRYFFYLKA